MKKILICLAISFCAPITLIQAEEPIDGQAIITDCGTVHQIPKDSTVDEAIDALDYWSEKDC